MTSKNRIALVALICAPASFAQLINAGGLGGGVCRGVVINFGGSVAGTCRNSFGNVVAFRKPPAPAVMVQLPVVASGKPCRVMDMNNDGAISGNCENAQGEWVPVRWPAGSPPGAAVQLQPAGLDVRASAGAINASGAIVGESISSGGQSQVVLWLGGSATATALPLPGLLGLGTMGCSVAELNGNTDPGPAVAGTCSFSDGRTRAFRWTRTGLLGAWVATELDPVSGGTNCVAVDINASRQIAGSCANASGKVTAVRWPDPGTTPVSLDSILPADTQSAAVAINAQGLIAGNFSTSGGETGGKQHCFFWNPNNGVNNDLGMLPGGTWCRARDINDQNNTIVGAAETSNGNSHAFIWRQATGMIDLGTFGGPGSAAADVSDNSRVVGTAHNASRTPRAFYTDPFN